MRIESRTILFSFEKMALRDAVKSLVGRTLRSTLDFFTREVVGSKFERWVDAVASLHESNASAYLPLVTVLVSLRSRHTYFLETKLRASQPVNTRTFSIRFPTILGYLCDLLPVYGSSTTRSSRPSSQGYDRHSILHLGASSDDTRNSLKAGDKFSLAKRRHGHLNLRYS